MKIKTSDLTKLAFDWAVAKAVGLIDSGAVNLYMPRSYDEYSSPLGYNPARQVYYCNDYRPTRDWEISGPILASEVISVYEDRHWSEGRYGTPRFLAGYELTVEEGACYSEMTGQDPAALATEYTMSGDTYLEAGLRSYIAKTLGYEVDIPEELL